MKPPPIGAMDLQVVARNIFLVRRAQGLTQVQLAAKASVSVPSVFRAEKAQPVRISTLRKIAHEGLNVLFDTLLVPKTIETPGEEVVLHRARDETWYALSDSRRHAPEDQLVSYQDHHERIRLGQLGFVPGGSKKA